MTRDPGLEARDAPEWLWCLVDADDREALASGRRLWPSRVHSIDPSTLTFRTGEPTLGLPDEGGRAMAIWTWRNPEGIGFGEQSDGRHWHVETHHLRHLISCGERLLWPGPKLVFFWSETPITGVSDALEEFGFGRDSVVSFRSISQREIAARLGLRAVTIWSSIFERGIQPRKEQVPSAEYDADSGQFWVHIGYGKSIRPTFAERIDDTRRFFRVVHTFCVENQIEEIGIDLSIMHGKFDLTTSAGALAFRSVLEYSYGLHFHS